MRSTANRDTSVAEDNQSALHVKPELDLSSPLFSPNQYLAVTHGCTSFSSLQSELAELKRTTSDKTEQLKALVSAHFDQYLSCHEAVHALADDVRAHQSESNELLTAMGTLKHVTDSTLSVLLERAKEQRRIRNTISVLSRFRPVFEITTKMKESMRSKNYEKLAEDYCRLKYYSTKSNISVLQQVFTAAHAIAQAANIELLKHFDDTSLSVAEQKRAISVLNALGFADKPTLICLDKQFDYLERKLQRLADERDAVTTVKECTSIIYRFRSGLWSFICEAFKTPSSSGVSSTVTSSEAEVLQTKAWNILTACTQLMQTHASPPSPLVLKQLNESFQQLNSLKKCPNAATLNANIAQLKDAFCDKFRVEIVLAFVAQVCEEGRDALMQEYFDPIVATIPSFATESSIDVTALGSDDQYEPPFIALDASGLPLTRVAQLVADAANVFDETRNASMISSESKIEINRASILTCCATDVMRAWDAVWGQIGSTLLDMLDSSDATAGAGASADASAFRTAVITAFKRHLYDMLALFLEKLLRSFVTEISPPTTLGSVAGSTKSRGAGVEACVLFAVVSNCIELRGTCLERVSVWLTELASGSGAGSLSTSDRAADLRKLVLETESKCVEMYVTMHTGPLLRVLKSGAAEMALQCRVASSAASRTASRTDSRTSSVGSGDMSFAPLSPPSTPTTVATPLAAAPNDGRQYVFNVLLQLITLRSEIETSLASYKQCPEYVRAVTFQLTSTLSRFLEDSARELDTSSELSEWHRIHLLVETRFFLSGLSDVMSEATKIQLIALEKALQQTHASEHVARAQVALLNQMKHQSKLYLLALASSSSSR